MRLMISPISCLSMPSGLISTRVRSVTVPNTRCRKMYAQTGHCDTR
ncbi:Uncharacterised protein [Mycobacterium tuberculosis]|nr:Uncharacterised protein [Mycobacterium tuberculosis]